MILLACMAVGTVLYAVGRSWEKYDGGPGRGELSVSVKVIGGCYWSPALVAGAFCMMGAEVFLRNLALPSDGAACGVGLLALFGFGFLSWELGRGYGMNQRRGRVGGCADREGPSSGT